jgi:hypothetical protein|tara:strand:- start:602 stop:976 length:375 start_codon:yes stop_codon:yes gene_type:complete
MSNIISKTKDIWVEHKKQMKAKKVMAELKLAYKRNPIKKAGVQQILNKIREEFEIEMKEIQERQAKEQQPFLDKLSKIREETMKIKAQSDRLENKHRKEADAKTVKYMEMELDVLNGVDNKNVV